MKWQRNLQHLGTTVSEQRDVVRNKERKENLKISIPKDNKKQKKRQIVEKQK
jgi:hypothetical protein